MVASGQQFPQEPVFDITKCPVPFVPKIPQGAQIIDDCDIPPPPDPIFDCPDLEVPIPPPIPRIGLTGCPQFQLFTFVVPGQEFDLLGEVVQTNEPDEQPCEYEFLFVLQVPENIVFPCPDIFGIATIQCTVQDCNVFLDIVKITESINVPLGIAQQQGQGQQQACQYQFQFQFQVPQGPQGPPGPKTAIMPVAGKDGTPLYLGLYCTEMPSAYFMDIMKFRLQAYQTEVPIDPHFLAVCEEDSVCVVSAVPSEPVLLGVTVSDKNEVVIRSPELDTFPEVVVTVAGVRRGFGHERFPRFSERQMHKNNRFWAQAHEE